MVPASRATSALYAVAVLPIVLALFWYFWPAIAPQRLNSRYAALPSRQTAIAVLPFVNISGKSDEDYFSDGMTEELLERPALGFRS